MMKRSIRKEMGHRAMAMALSVCMTFTLFPSTAFAEMTGGGGKNVASACAHLNEDATYSCAPIMDEDASPSDADASPSNADETYVCDHTDGCGYAEAVAAVQAVIAMIDNLPTVDDIYENVPRVGDSGYAEWQERMQETIEDIKAAKAAYDKLSAANQALIGEEHTYKLLDLVNLSEMLALMAPQAENPVCIGNQGYGTLAEAFNAVTSTDPDQPTVIELCKDLTFGTDGDIQSAIAVPVGKCVKLTSREGGSYTISRKAANGLQDPFFKVYDSSTLILENVTLDGKNLSAYGESYFVIVAGADIILKNGAVLKNNAASAIKLTTGSFNNIVSAATMDGGEISGNSAPGINMLPKFMTQNGKTLRFTMNGGVIRDNIANGSGGGIYGSNSYSGSGCTAEVIIHDGKITGNQSTGSGDTIKGGGGVYCNSRFIMDGGTISGNSAQKAMGGGVYFGDGVSEARITGGTIADNTATGLEDERKGKGSNIYINTVKTVIINPKADINGIFLFQEASLLITAALKHQVELEGAYQRNMDMTDLVVAEAGNGYALTEDDLAKFSWKGGAYGFEKSALNDKIKLTYPPYSVVYHLTGMKGDPEEPNLPTSLARGKDLTISLVADDGYKLPAESVTVMVDGTELAANSDYQLLNYSSNCTIAIPKAKITGDVEITAKGEKKKNDASLQALIYYYANDPGDLPVPGFSSSDINGTYDVLLPPSVSDDAWIYVEKTKSDSNATSIGDSGAVRLSGGKGTWSVTITAEDGSVSNTYTVNFKKAVYEIALMPKEDKDFTEAIVGYGEQLPHSITVTNSGNQETGDLTVELTGENPGSFTLSAASIDSIGTEGSGSFTVRPITGLDAGEYRAVVTVSGENGITAGFQVSFKVNPAAVPLSSIAVTTPPSKTVYKEGETFVSDGMVVTATYSDNSTRSVTGYTVDPSSTLTAGTAGVTISYTENGITKTATQPITVNGNRKSSGGSTSSSDTSGGNAINTVVRVQTTAPTVTVGETGTTVAVGVDAGTVQAAVQEARTRGAAGHSVTVSVQLPGEALASQIKSQDSRSVSVEVEVPTTLSGSTETPVTEIILPREVVQAAQSAGKDLTVTVKDERGVVTSQWMFSGEELKKSAPAASDVNLALTIVPVKTLSGGREPVRAAVANTTGIPAASVPGLFIDFGHNGLLPAMTRIRIPTGNDAGIQPGSVVYLYYYNSVTGGLELQPGNPYTVDQDGYVTLSVTNGTEYVLAPAALSTPTDGAAAGSTAAAPDVTGQNPRIHVIQKGDTLNRLAGRYGCTVEEILALNQINDVYDLRIGQEVVIPE